MVQPPGPCSNFWQLGGKTITVVAAEGVDRALAALAHRQRGYVTRRQLLKLGLRSDAIVYRVSLGRLIPVYAGVYAVGHVPTSPIDHAAAAVLACGPAAALSHASGATLWGFAERWRTPFEVTARTAHRRRGIRVHRIRTLARDDVTTHLRVRVTSPARTVLDLAPRLSEKALTRMVNDALLSRYLRLPDLAELLSRSTHHPGTGRLRQFVGAATGPTRSRFEDEFATFARRFDLPEFETNVRVEGREVDVLFRSHRLIVELDGFDFHASQGQFKDDRNRDADMLAAGLQTVRVTWDRLTRSPRKEAERLTRILRAPHGDVSRPTEM